MTDQLPLSHTFTTQKTLEGFFDFNLVLSFAWIQTSDAIFKTVSHQF